MKTKKRTTPLPNSRVSVPKENRDPRQRKLGVLDNFSKRAPSRIHSHAKPKHSSGPRANHQGQGKIVSQKCQPLKTRLSERPVNKGLSCKLPCPSDPNRHKNLTPAPPQRRKKRKLEPLGEPLPSPSPLEHCISHLPAGVPFPKKPDGCKIIPQTIEPGPEDRSTVYFTHNGVLGMPLQYMYDLDHMDDGDEPVDLGLDPTKSCHITLVIAWPGYKEATYEIIAYTPLYPTAPFVTIYGLRQLTKRELAIETLRCVHRWMVEHPWSGERHQGIPEWKLSGKQSPGVSAKAVWLAMISPVGDGRWVTQLQKAPMGR